MILAYIDGTFYTLATIEKGIKWIPVRPPWNPIKKKVIMRKGKTRKDRFMKELCNEQ